MMVLFDTNVLLDVILDRKPFATPATLLLAEVERGYLQGYLCATTITTIYYLTAKALGNRVAVEAVRKLLTIFEIAPVNRHVLETALSLGFRDFEDAVIYAAARWVEVDVLVTRDESDFKSTHPVVMNPQELVALLQSLE